MVVKKFIDDVSGAEKILCYNEYVSKIVNETNEIRYIHAQQAQCLFDKVRLEASEKGMKLNPQKTTLLCITSARSYTPKTFIKLNENEGEDIIL